MESPTKRRSKRNRQTAPSVIDICSDSEDDNAVVTEKEVKVTKKDESDVTEVNFDGVLNPANFSTYQIASESNLILCNLILCIFFLI